MAISYRGEGGVGGARGGSGGGGAARAAKLAKENKRMTGINQTAPSTSSKNKKIAKSTLTAHQQIVREKGPKTTPKVPVKPAKSADAAKKAADAKALKAGKKK